MNRSRIVATGRRILYKVVPKRSSVTAACYVPPPPPSVAAWTWTSSPFRWYSQKLDTHPIFTKCVSAGLIAVCGNVLAQKITHERSSSRTNTHQEFQVDWNAVGRFAFLNVAYVAPVLHHWYQFVNRAFPGKTAKAVWTRVFWDEFVFTPMYLPVFMGGLWSMEGIEWERVKHMLLSEMPHIITAEWVLWVPTMAMTFRYAPVKYQVLVINTVGVVWQTFLSLMAQQAQEAQTTTTNDDEYDHHHPVKILKKKEKQTAAAATPPIEGYLLVKDVEVYAPESYNMYLELS